MNQEIFSALKLRAKTYRSESAATRAARLKTVLQWVLKHEEAIATALYDDFKKPKFETFLSETYPVISELKYFLKNLKCWMKDKKVRTPVSLIGHQSRIRYENKGVVLIISPWNYPFQLAINPLIAALAAGNTAVIKPSELTPATSLLIQKLVFDCFKDDEVRVELGDKEKTNELLGYKFDHVFFTGSTAVGRIISKACAERLIPVTLELGGKSATIIDETADLENAVDKIFWGKFLNRGQSCVAPDYVLVHENVAKNFTEKIKNLSEKYTYGQKAHFINEAYHQRLKSLSNTDVDFHKKSLEIVELQDTSAK